MKQIRGLEEQLLRAMSKLRAHQLVGVLGVEGSLEWERKCKGLETLTWEKFMELLPDEEVQDQVLDLVEEKIVARDAKKRLLHSQFLENKTNNRSLYLPYPVLTYSQFTPKEGGEDKRHWRYEHSLRAQGLMSLAVEAEWGVQSVPVAMNVLNLLPKNDEGEQAEPGDEAWYGLIGQNLAVSGKRLIWNRNSPAWGWLSKMFPDAVDFSAYNHSLNAPVLPGGFFPKQNVQVRVLRNREGRDLETDGSGIYHPKTPELQGWIAKYGLVPIQFRFINRQGIFAKGVLFPSELAVDNESRPCVVLDWLQIKGVWKPKAKQRRSEDAQTVLEGYLGFIQVWSKPGTLKAGFELLENLVDDQETRNIIDQVLEQKFQKLQKQGIDGLVAKLVQDDPNIELLMKLVAEMKALGAKLEVTQIPRIREALEDKLGRTLYHLAQGAGIEFRRYVCRLDSQVPPGKVVMPGMKWGTKVCGFRFPIVLTQGLVSLEVIKPPDHLVIDGEPVKEAVVMNPQDLTWRMQGDDDGDIVGLSADPLMLKLFQHRDSKRLLFIEPKGVPRLGEDGQPIKTNSMEGLELIMQDQRGPVGEVTNVRSRMKALGLLDYADAFSLIIQEAVDRAKRLPEWSDYRLAHKSELWTTKGPGHVFTHKLHSRFLNPQGDLDMKKLWGYETEIIKELTEVPKKEILGWMRKRKRINPRDWNTCLYDETVGNLVHYTHNRAHSLWQEIQSQFKFNNQELELETVLPLLLDLKGIPYQVLTWDYEEYKRGIRKESGLTDFCKALAQRHAQVVTDDPEKDEAHMSIQELTGRFNSKVAKLTLDEIVTGWILEAQSGNPNNCFRLVSWPGSPVLKILDIEVENDCDYLLFKQGGLSRQDWFLQKILGAPNMGEELSRLVHRDTRHFEQVKDLNGEGIPMWQCQHCIERLQTAAVLSIREQKKRNEFKALGELISKLRPA